MIEVILGVLVVIQGGVILEASAAVHICPVAAAAAQVTAIVTGAEGLIWLHCCMIHYVFLVALKN